MQTTAHRTGLTHLTLAIAGIFGANPVQIPKIKLGQISKLDLQCLLVPVGQFRQPIVRDTQSPNLRTTQMGGRHRRDHVETKQPGRFIATVTRDDDVILVNQNRNDKTEGCK